MHFDDLEVNSAGGLIEQLKSARQLTREYDELLDVLPDIVYKLDPEGHFFYLSKAVASLGYTPQELIGKHFSLIVHPDDLPNVSRKEVLPRLRGKATDADHAPKLFDERRTGERMTRNLIVRLLPKNVVANKEGPDRKIFAGEVNATGQYRDAPDAGGGLGGESADDTLHRLKRQRQSGEMLYAEIATFGEYADEGKKGRQIFVGTIGVIRDISQCIRLEQQLFHSRKMEAIGELAGGIAHDFNNLLGVILGYTDMIRREFSVMDPRLEKYTRINLAAIDQAADLTGKLLAFAHKGKYESVPLDMHELVNDTTQLLKHTIDRKINIRQALSAPRTCIAGDLNQLKSMLMNVALNARDAMPEGGEMVFSSENISLLESDGLLKRQGLKAGDYLLLAIRDTGTGMDSEVKERVFEPFFTTKGMGKGTGLGLASVYGIVSGHNGMITVESERGVGTVFKIYFPTVQDAAPVRSAGANAANHNTGCHGSILLVDDEKMILDLSAEMLTSAGYSVITFEEGGRAIAYYREHFQEIDLVILDMIMPYLNGKECFQALREINRDIVAIISTGYGIAKDARDLAREGVAGFLQKPFRSDELFRYVDRALRGKGRTAPLPALPIV